MYKDGASLRQRRANTPVRYGFAPEMSTGMTGDGYIKVLGAAGGPSQEAEPVCNARVRLELLAPRVKQAKPLFSADRLESCVKFPLECAIVDHIDKWASPARQASAFGSLQQRMQYGDRRIKQTLQLTRLAVGLMEGVTCPAQEAAHDVAAIAISHANPQQVVVEHDAFLSARPPHREV